jgi:predicted negative regulator of RcsB-dependent stress response
MDAEEQEQLERLRAIVARYWKHAALVAAVLIAVVGGAYYWRASEDARQAAAAAALAQLRVAALDNDADGVRAAFAEIEKTGSDSYRDLGAFAFAAFLFAEGDLDGAAAALDAVIAASDDGGFREIARLRRAQIDIDAGRADDALARLDENPPTSARLRILYEEAAGDALAAKGDLQAARVRYRDALEAAAAENALHQTALQSKLAALNSRPPSADEVADENADEEDDESGEGADESEDANGADDEKAAAEVIE